MNWNLVVGPSCLLVGMLIALYVKDRARDVAKEQFTESIAAALAVFKSELLSSMDKVYIRSNECQLMRDAQDDRVDIASKRLDSIDIRLDNIKNYNRREH